MAEPLLSADVLDRIARNDEALDRGSAGPGASLALLQSAGLMVAPLPVEAGGLGWGTLPEGALPMLDVLMALGAVSLPIARIYEGHVNALRLINLYGAQRQRRDVAAAVQGGSIFGVWGADSAEAVRIDDQHSLTGAKAFASGLGDLTHAIITARTAEGLQMVLADVRDTARHRQDQWDVAAMLGSRSGGFNCAGLPAGRAHLLGNADDLFREPHFQGGICRLAAAYAGALTSIARMTAALLDKRGALDNPLAMHRLGHLAMEAEGAKLWARSACLAVEHGGDEATAVRTTLFAREAIEQGADRALSIAERLAGTSVHRRGDALGRRMRDLRLYLRQADLDGKLRLATLHWLAGG